LEKQLDLLLQTFAAKQPMNNIKRLFSESLIDEAKVGLPNKYNQFYVLTGPPGSGKGYVKKNIINDLNTFKEFDVDEGKSKVIKWLDNMSPDRKITIPFGKSKSDWKEWFNKNNRPLDPDKIEDRKYIFDQSKKLHIEDIDQVLQFFNDAKNGKYWKKSDWNIGSNPTHTSLLHGLEKGMGVTKTTAQALELVSKNSNEKPNYLIDMVATDPGTINEVMQDAKNLGYATTLICVISDKVSAWINNTARGRIVPRSKFDLAHKLTPETIVNVVFQNNGPNIDRIFFVFSRPFGAGKPLENLNDYLANEKIPREERKEALKIVTGIARKKGMDVHDVIKMPEFRGSHAANDRDVIELVKNGESWNFPTDGAKERFYSMVERPPEVDTTKTKNWLRYLRDLYGE
jgi:hypothetical protein